MKFDTFITDNNITNAQAAHELGVLAESVRVWRKGKTIPLKPTIQKITDWSHGNVTILDWYGE